jgi:hypothetical protein
MKFGSMTMKPEVILIILGIVLIFGLMYLNQYKEGFEGAVPAASQTSAIPRDTPGATSTNPTASKPQARDIEDIQERLKNFVLLADAKYPSDTNLSQTNILLLLKLLSDEPILREKLKKSLVDFDTSGFSLKEFGELRNRIDDATNMLRMATITAPPATSIEIQTTLDALGKFSTLVNQKRPENTDLPENVKADIMALRDSVPDLEQRLLAALAKSDATNYTKNKLDALKNRIVSSTDKLQGAGVVDAGAGTQVTQTVSVPMPTKDETYAAMIAAEPKPTVVAGPVGVITLDQLKDLVKRIDAEHLRLSNLRSTSATVTTRIQQLALLKTNISEFVTKVELKQMKLEDVPITQDAATKFLADLEGDSGPLPPLIVPSGSLPKAVKAPTGVAQYAGVPAGEQAVAKLLTAAKDLRWSMEVRLEYDPHMKSREAMLGRLENIIKNLTTLNVSETPIPREIHEKYVNEITKIQSNMASAEPTIKRGGDVGAMSRLPIGYARTPQGAPEPSVSAVSTAQGAGFGPQINTFPHGEVSPDVYTRPGFVMNDEQIAHRASAASFIPAAGGADYKARSLELCRQVKAAQLGGPANFGCIENPNEVGPSYDWKGNYIMVCNRLGDSWGRSYPAQFGCPPYDPTAKFSSGF